MSLVLMSEAGSTRAEPVELKDDTVCRQSNRMFSKHCDLNVCRTTAFCSTAHTLLSSHHSV